jgi:hypothetical protein
MEVAGAWSELSDESSGLAAWQQILYNASVFHEQERT